ncbi:MAG TPA: polyphenol oxidase family protein [Acidobacteriota bacterium]|nr:polyphenol oxidase family protein [Acidobacteriota bacterium]
MFRQRVSRGVPFHVFSELEAIAGLVHAFSTRHSDAPHEDAERPARVAGEKSSLWKALGIEAPAGVRCIHSARIVEAAECHPGKRADGILTAPGQVAAVRTADCLGVIIVDPRRRRCAVLHAGWRGTLGRIAARGAERLRQATGSHPSGFTAALGPSIRACCYEVGGEVREAFAGQGHPVERIFTGRRLDLVECNRLQLRQAGVGTILDSRQCTSCRPDLYYSWRRNRDASRLVTVAGFLEGGG